MFYKYLFPARCKGGEEKEPMDLPVNITVSMEKRIANRHLAGSQETFFEWGTWHGENQTGEGVVSSMWMLTPLTSTS